ncbi:MAG: response regulator [Spirosoma sp.]|nr:response regulator [Spirosoma sp.]
MPTTTTNSVIRQLQAVFTLSTLLLLVSLGASFYSIQQLIRNSELVNHTNQVLIEAETVMSLMKDAETGQRGYILTLDTRFLQPYIGSYERVNASYGRLRKLTADNPNQQASLNQVKTLFENRFVRMQAVLDQLEKNRILRLDTNRLGAEMVQGKQIMIDLRETVDRIKLQESGLLESRLRQQQFYIIYTPLLLVISALISMLITGFTYVRIKRDLDERREQQLHDDQLYRETAIRINSMETVTRQIAGGNYAVRSPDDQDDELGRISTALNKMAVSLDGTFADLDSRNWLQTGAAQISNAIRGEKNIHQLATRLTNTLATYLEASLGTLYILDADGTFKLTGSYAAQRAPAVIDVNSGLLGKAIEQKRTILIRDLPAGYTRVSSSLGDALPTTLLLTPLVYDSICIGAIEMGFLAEPNALAQQFIEDNREPMAISINAALNYGRLQNFLEETQAQSEELQVQHEELENLNAELEMQTQKLQASDEELRVQQEELQQTNAQLEERGLLLEERNTDIQRKADELELATRYKSEFLANMSHELRTPLNSILLLSRLLAENNEQNLTDDQVEYATVIRSSGNGLLGLIDEILDLSQIEAGQMTLDVKPVPVADLASELQGLFGLLAQEKGLDFSIRVATNVPQTLETDAMRLGQILKNLLSNALKFTASGSVSLTIDHDDTGYSGSSLLCFAVRDTGIGIAPDKQPRVFEAFQQADGSTKRKYGGTGLGLSISRELAKLLGGEITVQSEEGEGSTFTLLLPPSGSQVGSPAETPAAGLLLPPAVPPAALVPANEAGKYISATIPEPVSDDRHTIAAVDKVILIVEDDTNFAKSLLDYARNKGYKGIVAVRGDDGPKLAVQYRPLGILLDIQLPVMSGWQVMDALKANPLTRPIPVHMMSSHRMKTESRMKGAIAFVDKPMAFEQMQEVFKKIEHVLAQDTKKVLIIEDNPKHARALAYFLESFNIHSELKSDIFEGVDGLKENEVDCVILDMGVPDEKAYATLEAVKKSPGLEDLPIIVFTGKSLSMHEELKIKKYADSIIVKTAHSYQRMLDEVSLFLHIVDENRQNTGHGPARKLGALNQVLAGKTVLVADDDVRNIFALSKALEQYNMTVIPTLDGKEALQKLRDNPAIDLVLLDMMMPQMDGYETAHAIREHYQWKNLPVIAVTAKAMTGDRDKCIQAGASDYITKPVDVDQLISLLRVWLYDRG